MLISVIPRNGLGNRLRALSSALYLAEYLSAEIALSWLPCPALSEDASVVFERASPWPVCHADRTHSPSVNRLLGFAPRTLFDTYHKVDGKAFIIGGRWGEQWGIRKFIRDLSHGERFKELVVVSGGNFFPQGHRERWLRRKQIAFQDLAWRTQILECVPEEISTCVGVHLRFGDQIALAPPPERLVQSFVKTIIDGDGEAFLVTDDYVSARPYVQALATVGVPLIRKRGPVVPSRKTLTSFSNAAVDWISLARSRRVVHFAHSSFGEEAGIACGASVPVAGRRRFSFDQSRLVTWMAGGRNW